MEQAANQEVKEAKKPKVKKADLGAQLDKMVDILGSLNNRLVALEDSTKTKHVAPEQPAIETMPSNIPENIREIINTELNQKFNVEVASRDMSSFVFSIYVPREYSNEKPAYLEFYKNDIRSRRIPNAQEVIGVRQWARRVFENLPIETRSRIIMDRIRE